MARCRISSTHPFSPFGREKNLLRSAAHEKKGDSFIFLLCARAQKKTGIVFTSRSKFGLLAAASCGGSGCSQGVLTCRALEVQGVFGVKSSLMFRGQMALRVTQRRGEDIRPQRPDL